MSEEDPLGAVVFMDDPARACRGMPVERFYPELGADPRRIAATKRVCGRCPVQAACLAYALATREPYGIWGGKSTRERRAMLGRTRHRRQQATRRVAA